jgi:hypothetical protein
MKFMEILYLKSLEYRLIKNPLEQSPTELVDLTNPFQP